MARPSKPKSCRCATDQQLLHKAQGLDGRASQAMRVFVTFFSNAVTIYGHTKPGQTAVKEPNALSVH